MVSDIISKYGKVKYAYLVGPEFDIYKVYLVFEIFGCFRVELKAPFHMIEKYDEVIDIHEYVHLRAPDDAYLELANCDYHDPRGKRAVLKPDNDTLQIVMEILLESV